MSGSEGAGRDRAMRRLWVLTHSLTVSSMVATGAVAGVLADSATPSTKTAAAGSSIATPAAKPSAAVRRAKAPAPKPRPKRTVYVYVPAEPGAGPAAAI